MLSIQFSAFFYRGATIQHFHQQTWNNGHNTQRLCRLANRPRNNSFPPLSAGRIPSFQSSLGCSDATRTDSRKDTLARVFSKRPVAREFHPVDPTILPLTVHHQNPFGPHQPTVNPSIHPSIPSSIFIHRLPSLHPRRHGQEIAEALYTRLAVPSAPSSKQPYARVLSSIHFAEAMDYPPMGIEDRDRW